MKNRKRSKICSCEEVQKKGGLNKKENAAWISHEKGWKMMNRLTERKRVNKEEEGEKGGENK